MSFTAVSQDVAENVAAIIAEEVTVESIHVPVPETDETAEIYRSNPFDEKHKTCLEKIAEDADMAYEEAMIWRGDGGGRRARHCEAMALFALGHEAEAAHRLDQLGAMVGQVAPNVRKNYYLEAANFWMMAKDTNKAYISATSGLDIDGEDTGLRIARARVYALLDRYEDSEIDLTSALVHDPENAAALRYRADARHHLSKLDLAREDIEKALELDPTSVETALLRGRIVEAQRLQTEEPAPQTDLVDAITQAQ